MQITPNTRRQRICTVGQWLSVRFDVPDEEEPMWCKGVVQDVRAPHDSEDDDDEEYAPGTGWRVLVRFPHEDSDWNTEEDEEEWIEVDDAIELLKDD